VAFDTLSNAGIAGVSWMTSISAMAESRIERTLLRCWTTSDSKEVFVIVIGKTRDATLLLDTGGRMLLLKVLW
jgi:hypothetical protein